MPTALWRWLGACLLIAVGRRDSAGMLPDLVHGGPGEAPEGSARGTDGSCPLIAVSWRDSVGILPTVLWRWVGACLLIAVGRRDSAGMLPDFVHEGPGKAPEGRARSTEGSCPFIAVGWRDSVWILPTVLWRWLGACLLIAVGRRDSAGMRPVLVHLGPRRS